MTSKSHKRKWDIENKTENDPLNSSCNKWMTINNHVVENKLEILQNLILTKRAYWSEDVRSLFSSNSELQVCVFMCLLLFFLHKKKNKKKIIELE